MNRPKRNEPRTVGITRKAESNQAHARITVQHVFAHRRGNRAAARRIGRQHTELDHHPGQFLRAGPSCPDRDENGTLGTTKTTELYWDLFDRLINRVVTPNDTVPGDYTVNTYTPIEGLATAEIALDYVGGTWLYEDWRYTALTPTGLPEASYSYSGAGSPSVETWRGEHGPFGELWGETDPATRPPWGYVGQLVLDGTESSVWNGSSVDVLRGPLHVNMWRTYDPRVGQYLTPEPVMVEGEGSPVHPFNYGRSSPDNYVDRNGLWMDSVSAACLRNPALCGAMMGGMAAGAAAAGRGMNGDLRPGLGPGSGGAGAPDIGAAVMGMCIEAAIRPSRKPHPPWPMASGSPAPHPFDAGRSSEGPCNPCPQDPPPRIDRVPPSTPHPGCTGDHWHYTNYSQNSDCTCFLDPARFGGCCGEPADPETDDAPHPPC